jgi:transcriptional regulator with XRE-family HTH domain/molybdopterin-binding protein
MRKRSFGDILRRAREAKALSLRQLADRVDIEYSRLAKIELGTRPAPGLTEVRRLADALDIDMTDLVVAGGTSREVMDHLLWCERLQSDAPAEEGQDELPERRILLDKNTFRVRVVEQEGALCTVKLGGTRLRGFSFFAVPEIVIRIPPEAVVIHRSPVEAGLSTAENVLPMRVRKLRRLGQVTNLVLEGAGFEMNSLHAGRAVERMKIVEGDLVYAAVQATAVRTALPAEEEP